MFYQGPNPAGLSGFPLIQWPASCGDIARNPETHASLDFHGQELT
jgi:hypothetical protein